MADEKAKRKRAKTIKELQTENQRLKTSLSSKRAEARARKKLIAEGYKNVSEL